MITPSRLVRFVFLISAIFGSSWSLAAAAPASLDRGIEAFQAGRYDIAKLELIDARDDSPNDGLVNLWLGLALQATGGAFDGADAWRAAAGNPQFEPMAKMLRGLSYWKAGYASGARQYFEEATLRVADGARIDFPLARRALAALAAGNPVPPIGQWPEWAGIPTSPTGVTAGDGNPARPLVAPVAEARPAPAVPAPPVRRNTAEARVTGYKPWEAFPSRRVGEIVQYRPANVIWKTGRVTEVGTSGAFADKYLIVDSQTQGTGYYYYGDVAGLERQDFWTGFFVGTWALGSGMAVSTRTDGNQVRDEYLYVGATEQLVVNADGSYVWTVSKTRQIKGRWVPLENSPGIQILQGEGGRDYTFYNCTDNATVDVMKEHHARLSNPAVMSTLARRKIP